MKKRALILCIALIVLAVIFSVRSAKIKSDSNGINIPDSITITIENGESGNSIISKLAESGAIKYPKAFKKQAKKSGYITKFKPGNATIESGMTYTEIMELLASDNRNMVKVTIPEGYEIRQIAEKLAKTGVISEDEFYSAAKADKYDYRFLKNIPKRENELEGYLYPDTYLISENSSAEEIINMMLTEFDKHFKEEYYKQADKLDMTVDEIVILASIIERETNAEEERAKVSGVFHNRLRDNMRLQSCATVEYLLKDRKAKLTSKELSIDSKYNTYKYSGLPIGPIASPGAECIEAALYPEKTTAKYFVLGKDGKHIFSDTYNEHLNAKNKAES